MKDKLCLQFGHEIDQISCPPLRVINYIAFRATSIDTFFSLRTQAINIMFEKEVNTNSREINCFVHLDRYLE